LCEFDDDGGEPLTPRLFARGMADVHGGGFAPRPGQ
jgi:hypothetical protein